ncbi:MAG TPA: hypothetical protein VKQ06_10865 [Gammaproteobacteria bacterium]|nr:hypothetical protein [Gammaproteobacteria bacterium]
MAVFDYLGVMLSVIMGLGVTHLLAGLSKAVHHRRTVTFSWLHGLWTLNILIYIVIIWWGMFWWNTQEEWLFFQFLLLILYAIALFLAASLLFPWDLPINFDFDAHFFDTRPWFFSVLALAWCIDVPETLLKSSGGIRALPEGYVFLVVAQIFLSVLGALWSSRLYHQFYAIFWPILTVGYLSFTTLSQIAT